MKREELVKEISGEVIFPGDPLYHTVSTSYAGKGAPAVVVRPHNAGDIAAAIRFAWKNALVISVRSGGHSVAGHCTNNGGIIIDCSLMNGVEVLDAAQRLVRIGTGSTWKNAATILSDYGLAISSGDSTSVGVGGLTLGGGVGWMVRKYGLTIDSLVSAKMVTAEGNILRVSNDEHADLFWAIRGGGGNFGVVTEFEFIAQPVPFVHSGMIVYELKDLPSLLKGWRDHMRGAPDELTVMFLMMPAFFGNPPTALAWCCYAGEDESAAKDAIDPLLTIGTVVQNGVVRKKYADVLEEPHPPEGVKAIVNNGFVNELTDELIDRIAAMHCKEESPVLQLRSVGGAMNRVHAASTAFAHRSAEVLMISAAFVPTDATAEQTASAQAMWNVLAPFTSGAYANFFSSDGASVSAAVYPPATMKRLREVKKSYDPENIFCRNVNIIP